MTLALGKYQPSFISSRSMYAENAFAHSGDEVSKPDPERPEGLRSPPIAKQMDDNEERELKLEGRAIYWPYNPEGAYLDGRFDLPKGTPFCSGRCEFVASILGAAAGGASAVMIAKQALLILDISSYSTGGNCIKVALPTFGAIAGACCVSYLNSTDSYEVRMAAIVKEARKNAANYCIDERRAARLQVKIEVLNEAIPKVDDADQKLQLRQISAYFQEVLRSYHSKLKTD